MRTISVDRGLVVIGMQVCADGGTNCFAVHATAWGPSGLEEAGVAGAMGGMGAIGWLSTLLPSLGERAEAGTAIAAKMAKIGWTLQACRLASRRLQNGKREATSSRRQSKPSFMHNTRKDGRAAQLFIALESD